MQEEPLLLRTQERDRLKVMHELAAGHITQAQAGSQLQLSVRQVRRLAEAMRQKGDAGVLHGLRGQESNRKLPAKLERLAVRILSAPQCRDFGPTYAAEHLSKVSDIRASKETVRAWMRRAGLWQSRPRRIEEVHQWRARRACYGELVQWDTSVHDWLEGRGERLYLVAMIDDATSRLFARFVCHDSALENLRVLWAYLERFGRPVEFYTDKAGMFVTTKPARDQDASEWPLTQIGRALAELGIARTSAHSPQAKGRVERCFGTAQNRLVKGLRLAGVRGLEQANAFLQTEYLPEWNERFTVAPANPTDAHRPLTELHDLAASLSEVEMRVVMRDCTVLFRGQRYQIERSSVVAGLRGQRVRVEARLDGRVAMRYDGRYLAIRPCGAPGRPEASASQAKPVRKDHNRSGRSAWMRDFGESMVRSGLWKSAEAEQHG